jgi:hypothetical protein
VLLDPATSLRRGYSRNFRDSEDALLTADLLIGGRSTYGFLPDTTKLPQPVLSGTDRQDTVKSMQETAQNHGAEAAKKIETAR